FSGDERFHRRVFDLAGDDGPTGPVVPLSRIVHDRLVIEIRRGCTRGCRFCSSGMISRPVRERPPEQILRIAEQGLAATGYRDVSLLSLSSGDYSEIVRLVGMLTDRFRNRLVAVSLPSLRISTFDVTLAEQIGEVRKTGFTFAPEAGTERLRAVINKPLTDQQFAEVVDAVCRAGWQTLKFYFMIGLPTETDDDLQGIARMVRRAEQIGRGYWKGRLAINVTLAPFVPKPHTPFQWEAQVGREEMERRCRLVADGLHGSRSVHIKRHSVESSFIEAVLARGDRRVADALERAWQLGCNLDAWSDRFNLGLWLRAFEETGLDPSWYANRARSDDEVFPWDHIDAGPGKSFLLEQRRAAMRGEILDDCALEGCAGCQACSDGLGHKLVGAAAAQRPATDAVVPPSSASQQTSQPPESRVRARGRHRSMLRQQPSRAASEQPLPIQRIRLSYSKEGRLRFLSHLDMVKTWQLLVERAGLPIAYSRGFHPVALLQYSPPLAVGYGARGEWVDIFLRERMGPEQVVRRLAEIAPDGMRIFAPLEIALSAKALDRSIVAADFEIQLSPRLLESAALSVERIRQIWQESKDQAAGPAPQAQPQQEGCRSAALMEALEVISTSPAVLHMRIRQSGGNLPDPLRLLRALLGVELRLGDEAEVTRLGLISEPLSIRVPAR
ncbi:DUF2344 domain-containing protein, partial [Candidatus Sumerlaeota bacterium]|nr:DUF2344 domain-containing protein [Candidatus Sumerlaeota bacterium]